MRLVLLALVLATASARADVPTTQGKTLALVAPSATDDWPITGYWPCTIRVNDLPLVKITHNDGETSDRHYFTWIPDLLLENGVVRIDIAWQDDRVDQHGVELELVELSASEPRAIGKRLGK